MKIIVIPVDVLIHIITTNSLKTFILFKKRLLVVLSNKVLQDTLSSFEGFSHFKNCLSFWDSFRSLHKSSLDILFALIYVKGTSTLSFAQLRCKQYKEGNDALIS